MKSEPPKSPDLSADVRQIRSQLGAGECARLMQVDTSLIHRWAASGTVPVAHRRRVSDLKLIGDIFCAVGTPEIARRWMNAMNPALNYETPSDEILRGRWVATIAAARDYVSPPN